MARRYISRRNPATQTGKRFSVEIVKLYPWPYKDAPRKIPSGPKYFQDEETAIEEAVFLAVDQEAVTVVNDEFDQETVAMFDVHAKRGAKLRSNPKNNPRRVRRIRRR